MTSPNWGLLQNNALANLGYGLQLGQNMTDRREAREHRNALLGLKEQELAAEQAKVEHRAHVARVAGNAALGTPGAMDELAGLDIDTWSKLDARQRDHIKRGVDYAGQAALAVSRLPLEQRAAAWDQFAQQGVAQGFTELQDEIGGYSEPALQAALAQAGKIREWIEQNEPRYQAIPEGGTLVNTSDPAAVQSYMQSLGDVPPPPAGFTLDVPGGASGNAGGGFPGP